jgi:hypothetical protein
MALPPQKGMIKRPPPDAPKPGKADEDKTNPYSFKKWVEEKTEGGRLPYPKYSPPTDKITHLPFSEFPEAPPATAGRSGGNGGDTSAPPEPPAIGPEGITAIFSSRYSGSSFTPVWGTADEGPSSSESSSASGGEKKPDDDGKTKSEDNGKTKNVWLPFVQEDNLPPPPPSLNDTEE